MSNSTGSTANTNTQATDFLQQLRPAPWLLVAISTDNPPRITAVTANNIKAVDAFINAHNGKDNLYYSVNPTKIALNSKPKKIDIASVGICLVTLIHWTMKSQKMRNIAT